MRKNSNGTFSAEKTYLYEGRLQTVREIADKRGIPFPICLLNLDLKQMRGRFANAC